MRLLISKLLVYGTIGLLIEIIFTGVHSIIAGDITASSHSYLWMLLVYGTTALILEQISKRMKGHLFIKAIVYVPIIYVSEFTWGMIFKLVLGKCPWDYNGAGIHVLNVIRLDYGMFWYAAAVGFEWIYTKANTLFRYVSMYSKL